MLFEASIKGDDRGKGRKATQKEGAGKVQGRESLRQTEMQKLEDALRGGLGFSETKNWTQILKWKCTLLIDLKLIWKQNEAFLWISQSWNNNTFLGAKCALVITCITHEPTSLISLLFYFIMIMFLWAYMYVSLCREKDR